MTKGRSTQLGWGLRRNVAGGRAQRKLSRLSVRGKSFPGNAELEAIFEEVVPNLGVRIIERDNRSVTIESSDEDSVWNLLLPKIAEAMDAPALAAKEEYRKEHNKRKRR